MPATSTTRLSSAALSPLINSRELFLAVGQDTTETGTQ